MTCLASRFVLLCVCFVFVCIAYLWFSLFALLCLGTISHTRLRGHASRHCCTSSSKQLCTACTALHSLRYCLWRCKSCSMHPPRCRGARLGTSSGQWADWSAGGKPVCVLHHIERLIDAHRRLGAALQLVSHHGAVVCMCLSLI